VIRLIVTDADGLTGTCEKTIAPVKHQGQIKLSGERKGGSFAGIEVRYPAGGSVGRFCHQCGQPLVPGGKFCMPCGVLVAAIPSPVPSAASPGPSAGPPAQADANGYFWFRCGLLFAFLAPVFPPLFLVNLGLVIVVWRKGLRGRSILLLLSMFLLPLILALVLAILSGNFP